ncbi:hypothetical protein DL768_007811 [Monosporascus sp. mg162]|nr:hypothetical protein DL768_007811 [Monosporascus sp. mg162]
MSTYSRANSANGVHSNGVNGNGVNGNGVHSNGVNGSGANRAPAVHTSGTANGSGTYKLPASPVQTPVAVIGLACRLPGKSNSPEALWKFLTSGDVADPTPPSHRYNFSTHYDGSQRPGTMPHSEAAVMDPQQRQLLEVTYECLENSGVPLDKFRGTKTGCCSGKQRCWRGDQLCYPKRLDDTLWDGDTIRAVIRGSATNSDGNTTSLTQPSSAAQAAAIRMAYQNAGITDFNETGYLECHGTGTPTGDPIEVAGLASVFAPTRPADKPLIIGSIKSNVGHSGSAAGLSGLIKAVLSVESAIIPGTPTFIKPTPRIDHEKSRVRPTRRTIRWPQSASGRDSMVKDPKARKVFVFSSHGSSLFGGDEFPGTDSEQPHILVFSANDKDALQKNVQIMSEHLVDPAVHAKLSDVAYTLSERRTHHLYRGFITSKSLEITPDSMIIGKKKAQPPRVAFIFTGQGAQWSQMGKDLIQSFPLARSVIESLDVALQSLARPPQWSLLEELTEKRDAEVLRLPEFSQPLVTALQIALLKPR